MQRSLGLYHLVVSTKPFHPELWQSVYNYSNKCVCVPYGYDPSLHLRAVQPTIASRYDVLFVRTGRPAYESLLCEVAGQLRSRGIGVHVAGSGWALASKRLPDNCTTGPVVSGSAYVDLLQQAKIVISPLNPAPLNLPDEDVDTTRIYELAAAGCFFLHRRNKYVQSLYDERIEVPMWDDVQELVSLILEFIPDGARRHAMAAAAYARAVPAVSIPSRALAVANHIKTALQLKSDGR